MIEKIKENIVKINEIFDEFSKDLHSPYECRKLFNDINDKFGFSFEENPFNTQVTGISHPNIYGRHASWIDFNYSFFREGSKVRYEMNLKVSKRWEYLEGL